MPNVDEHLESFRPTAERLNGHSGPARCCCDRCLHVANLLAAIMLAGQLSAIRAGMQILDKGLIQRKVLSRVGGEVQESKTRYEAAAARHWDEVSFAAPGSVQ